MNKFIYSFNFYKNRLSSKTENNSSQFGFVNQKIANTKANTFKPQMLQESSPIVTQFDIQSLFCSFSSPNSGIFKDLLLQEAISSDLWKLFWKSKSYYQQFEDNKRLRDIEFQDIQEYEDIRCEIISYDSKETKAGCNYQQKCSIHDTNVELYRYQQLKNALSLPIQKELIETEIISSKHQKERGDNQIKEIQQKFQSDHQSVSQIIPQLTSQNSSLNEESSKMEKDREIDLKQKSKINNLRISNDIEFEKQMIKCPQRNRNCQNQQQVDTYLDLERKTIQQKLNQESDQKMYYYLDKTHNYTKDTQQTSMKGDRQFIFQLSSNSFIEIKIHKNRLVITLENYKIKNFVKIPPITELKLIELFSKNNCETKEIEKKVRRQLNQYLQNSKKGQVLIGGGCGSSRVNVPQKLNEVNEKQIKVLPEFEKKYKKWIDKSTISDNIENDRQFDMMDKLVKYFSMNQILITSSIRVYRLKTLDLLETYLIYYLSGAMIKDTNQDNTMQEDINEQQKQLSKFKQYIDSRINQYPCEDVSFYTSILIALNSSRAGWDERNKPKLLKIVEFIAAVIKHGANIASIAAGGTNIKEALLSIKDVLSAFIDVAKEVAKRVDNISSLGNEGLEIYQSRQINNLFTYLIQLWVKKAEKFGEKMWLIEVEDEIEFYIDEFLSLSGSQQPSDNLILLTLVKINYQFEKLLYSNASSEKVSDSEQQQNDLKKLSQFQEKFSYSNEKMINFIDKLTQRINQKGALDSLKQFFTFTVTSSTYRFLAISILLKYQQLLKDMKKEIKDAIMIHLSNQYLIEKSKSVSSVFRTNKDFVTFFNENIENPSFKQKLIENDKQRKLQLSFLPNISQFEQTINDEQDIHRMVVEILIAKWEEDIRVRQNQMIEHKDDILLEVLHLYISQKITYLKGNKAISDQLVLETEDSKDKEEVGQSEQNRKEFAIEVIISNFLKPNFISEKEQGDKENLRKCKVLGILAEGGTGKSILLKKLEMMLKEQINNNEKSFERANYIPLLVKCNSLDAQKPSIEDYLKNQGLTDKQIQNLKQSSRNKLILLDGYDEFTGEYFRVYTDLNLSEWKNTIVIVTSRKEKLTLSEACTNFSVDNDNGQRDESSYSIVKLEEFQEADMVEYYESFFKQFRTDKESKLDTVSYDNDIKLIQEYMKNNEVKQLLYLPINLYLFTRMIVDFEVSDNLEEGSQDRTEISDQIGIQEMFFKKQFKREAQEFIATEFKDFNQQKDEQLRQIVIDSYFQYFQTVSIQMFLNKGNLLFPNFLQLEKNQINFSLQGHTLVRLNKKQQDALKSKIMNYINSKIITRVKEQEIIETNKKLTSQQQNKQSNEKKQIIEFKHKSLFEYFAARAMKNDFDIEKDDIHKLSIDKLKQFNINKKCIMNIGYNQSEQQILIKFYKLIKKDIDSKEFKESYLREDIDKTNRYIQYLRRSTISKIEQTSEIDIGASNLLSALFISKFSYSFLNLSKCSFSKAYIPYNKDVNINFDRCNFSHAYLQKSNLSLETSNTKYANFDAYSKVFDSNNIYSFNQVAWLDQNKLISISQTGFLNIFDTSQKKIVILKSKQISNTSLSQVVIMSDKIVISSNTSLFLIDLTTLEILKTHTFIKQIKHITIIKSQILVSLKNTDNYISDINFQFSKLEIIGQRSFYEPTNQILCTYRSNIFYIWNPNQNFQQICNKVGQSSISQVAFSADGKYLATCLLNQECKVWGAQNGFELIQTIECYFAITSVAFSPDSQYLATSFDNNILSIWNVKKEFNLHKKIQGHSLQINSMTFSADSKQLATCSEDNTCKIWNAEKEFELMNEINGHYFSVSSVAFSANGKYLATGSWDKTCKIWNAQKGYEYINTIEGFSPISSIAFSPNGKYLAIGYQSNTCRTFNAEKDFEPINSIRSHSSTVESVAFSADGKFLATGSSDLTCGIWNANKDFELIQIIKGHSSQILTVAFSADSQYLTTGSGDCTFKIWNTAKDFELIHSIQGHSSCIRSSAFSADNKYFATGSDDNSCKIWNVEKGFDLINTIQSHSASLLSVAFSTDGKYLATGSKDNTCKIFNAKKGFELINTIEGHTSQINSVAFSADDKFLSTVSNDRACKIWNSEKGFEFINTIESHHSQINSVVFSHDRKYLATGSDDNSCKIWNIQKDFELIKTIEGHSSSISQVAFSANGKYLATASWDKTCKIWNSQKDFELIYTVEGHTFNICSVDFSANSKYLATGSWDNSCIIWNAEKDFEQIIIIKGHSSSVQSLSFSANCKYLATGSDDYTCKIWHVENNFQLINTIQCASSYIRSVIFSGDDKYLATTGQQGNSCKIWNAAKEFQLMYVIKGHSSIIQSVAFSADSKYLITGSFDNTCKIWNAEKDFRIINTIEGHSSKIGSVALSADGKYIATGSWDNSCKIWNAEKGFDFFNKIQDPSSINSIAFSADGKYLATADTSDNTCKIWNTVQNFNLIFTINLIDQKIIQVKFSNINSFLYLNTQDKWIEYEIENQKLLKEYSLVEFNNLKKEFNKNNIDSNKLNLFENILTL